MNNLGKFYIYLIIFNTFSLAQVHITTDTEWTSDQVLTGAVIVDAGATLTIAAGVQVQTFFVDTDADNIGDVEIEVLGGLKINGTPSNPVLFKPYETTTNKNYWTGIVINSSISNDSLNFFKVYNANSGIDISSPITLTGVTVRNSGGTGININTISNGDVSLNDITVKHSDDNGIVVNSPNVTLNWVFVDSCGGYGLVNQGASNTINNLEINNSSNTGLLNYSDLSVSNSLIGNNKHGLVSFSGDITVEYSDIKNNTVNGVLIGGAGVNSINFTSCENNGGYGIETTTWEQSDLNGAWSSTSDPTLSVNNSNIHSNHQTTVLDGTEYGGLWDNWTGQSYTAFGATNGWSTTTTKTIPFGRIGWIGFDFNSNNGGNNYSWQPCTSNSVWSWLVELRSSTGEKITYLSSSWQCPWNPLHGQNTNTWNSYENNTGLIHAPNGNWYIINQDVPSTSTYTLWQGFGYTYFQGTGYPEVKNFKLKFYFGGYEVSSYSNTSNLDYTLNYWGQTSDIGDLFNPDGNSPFNYSSFQIFEVATAHSTLDETDAISLTSPVAAASYETATSVAVTWTSSGWVPLVNIAISTDLGSTWSYLSEDIANTGGYSWWNDLAVGTTVYLKIEDSYDSSVSGQVGPFFVIENSTPIAGVSTTALEFDSTSSSLTFNIVNNGGGTLNWTATDDQDWLSISSASGSTSDQTEVTVTVNRIGMNPGDYTGTISITSDGGNATVGVNMTVAQPVMSITPTSLDFDSTLVELPFYISNTGGGSFTWTATPSTNWLAVNPASGTTMTQDTVLVTVDRSLTTLGVQTGLIIFSSSVGNTSISISMSDIGDPPVADAQTVIIDEDTPVSITLSGTDVDEDELTYSVITNPTIGTLSGTAPNLTYTPNTDVYGSDSLTFKVNDGTFDSSPATVSITVNAVNDSPIITDISDQSMDEDTSLDVTLSGTDVDSDDLTYSASSSESDITATVDGTTLTLTPALNWNGSATIAVTVSDGTLESEDTFGLTITPVNDAPLAEEQTVITSEDTPLSITLSGTDVDGDDLTYSVITNPTIGTLSGTAPNLTYTPNTDVYGSDSLTFKVNDGTFDSDPATVSIVINSTNDGPSISLPDDITFEEDGNLVVNFTPYVGDVDGDPLTLSVTDNTEVLVEIIDYEVTFGATDNWNGTETLIFTVDDSQGRAVAAASVDVIVISVNDEPTANAGTDSTYESPYPYDPADVTLDGNGSNDIDGNIVSYIWIESGTQVADIVSPTLTLALGDYTFTLTVTDNEGSTNSDDVIINVIEEPNTAPVANSATVVTDEDTPVSITLTGTDLEGDALLYTVETNPSNGTLSGDPPNLTYTPNTNYYGSDNFTFTVNDGVVDSDPATITITVEQINDPPVVSEIQDQEIDEDNSTGNIQFTVSDIDTDLEFIILSASSSNNALVPHDNIVIEGTGENRTISVTPAPNQNGTTIITVVADDVPPPVVLTITIVPDNYPNETSWELLDIDNTYIDGISPNTLTTPYEVYTWDIELSAGYYTFTIYDTYGDGLTGQGSGWYTLYIGDVEIVSGATFNYSESTTFSTNTSLFRIERVSYLNREPFNRGFDILSIENIEEYLADPVVVHNQTIPINSRETTSVSFSLLVNPVNDAPSSFVLEQPENNTQIVITNDNMSETLIFNWGASTDIDGDDLYYTIEGTDGLSFLSIDNLENNSLEWNYDELVNTIGFEPTVSGTWMVVSSDGELISEATNGPFNLTIDISEILTIDENLIPENFSLHQNHPNPFNPTTQIKYDLPEDAMVNITIYDIMGHSIKALVNSNQTAGYRSIQWDATNNTGQPVSAGLYLYTIQAGEFRQTKKMVLLK